MLRAILLKLAVSEWLKRQFVSQGIGRRMSRHFVAGEDLQEAIAAARALNGNGISASLDHLGESVSTITDAQYARDDYAEIINAIAQKRLDANISLKLTQLGLDVDEDACFRYAETIVQRAQSQQNFVRLDMESSRYTQRTLEICKKLREKSPAVGAVIQAYLYRSEADIHELLTLGCRVRLCKGAYREGPGIAFQKKSDVDKNYVRLMQTLLGSSMYHAIATHDPRMIDATIDFAAKNNIRRDTFEFQMLYGIREDLQRKLVRDGYRVRVYVPFGTEWFPYFMRRLAERPANLIFILKHLIS